MNIKNNNGYTNIILKWYFKSYSLNKLNMFIKFTVSINMIYDLIFKIIH